MIASLADPGAATDVFEARLVGLLRTAPSGSRFLDALIAEALGWETSCQAGRMHWRRWRTGWTAAGPSTPPRYSSDLALLLAELPTTVIVELIICHPQCQAAIEGRVALGHKIELALAGAVVRWRLADRTDRP